MSELIANVNRDYAEILNAISPAELAADVEAFMARLKNARAKAWDTPLPTYIKPYFLSAGDIAYFRKASNVMLECQEKLIKIYYEHPEHRELYELNEAEEALMDINPNLDRHIWFTRLDSMGVGQDFKFLEFNCDSPGGAYFADIQTENLLELGVMKTLAKKYEFEFIRNRPKVFETLMTAWGQFCANTGRPADTRPDFAVMGNPEVANVEEFKLFAEMFAEMGYSSFFIDPWALDYDGKTLTKDGKPISLVYRRGVIKDYAGHEGKAEPAVRAYRDGNVCFVNPFTVKLGDNKNLLSILTDERFREHFTEEEWDVCAKHIPWTRMMKEMKTDFHGDEVDLFEFVRANKDKFVLKPNAEYGGKGVVVGPSSEQAAWDEAVESALANPLVVQEYVAIPEAEFPTFEEGALKWATKKFNVNFLTFTGEYGGGFCRTSDSPVINISAGGALVTFLTVKG